MPELKPYKGDYYLWDYVPSLVAGAIFAGLFTLATVWIVWRMFRTRSWFSIPFVVGGVFEIIGYIARALSTDKTDELIPFIIQSILILVAPALFAASIYMTLGRLIRSVDGERYSFIRVSWLTKAFVAGDVMSFLVQSSGGGLMAQSSFDPKVAQDIILAGLVIQIIMFGLFAATAAIFHVRMNRNPTPASMDSRSPWKRIMTMLYTASACIMVRSIFRVIEYVMGKDGYPLQHEWTLYVFDAALMLSTMVIFGFWYPGELKARIKARDWDSVDSSGQSAPATGDGSSAYRLQSAPKHDTYSNGQSGSRV